MQTTIKDLISLQIFKSYNILSGKGNLERKIESISILETPDFDNYIIENSLILTTFYPVKNEVSVFEKLLQTLHKRQTAGILIKLNRYIEVIPEAIIKTAEELGIPIITLDYDVNLSLLFYSILSEMQNKDYSESTFDYDYASLLKQVYEKPSTETLMQIASKVPNIEVLFYNIENKKTYYTNKAVNNYFNQYKTSTNLFQRIDDTLYYTEDVIYDGNPIYRFVITAKEDKRHILHNYIEVFKLLIIIVYQKKIENTLKQHQFLINFISNPSNDYTNEQLIELSKRYSWNINFPIVLMIFTIKQNKKNVITPQILEHIRLLCIDQLRLGSDEVRYTVFNDQLLIIINANELKVPNDGIKGIYHILKQKYKTYDIKLTYSNLISETAEMSKTYALLSDALIHVEHKDLNISLFNEDSMRLLNLLRNIDYDALKEYMNLSLKALIQYEKKYNTPLIHTLFTYIENQFNASITAKKLFIHYNTVKYRLDIIKDLGISTESTQEGFFRLYFALFLYINFEQNTKK